MSNGRDVIARLQLDNKTLRDALLAAAGQFEFYAREHQAKAACAKEANDFAGAFVATAKAETNLRHANACRKATNA